MKRRTIGKAAVLSVKRSRANLVGGAPKTLKAICVQEALIEIKGPMGLIQSAERSVDLFIAQRMIPIAETFCMDAASKRELQPLASLMVRSA